MAIFFDVSGLPGIPVAHTLSRLAGTTAAAAALLNVALPATAEAIPHGVNPMELSITGYDYLFNPEPPALSVEWVLSGCQDLEPQSFYIGEDSMGCGPFDRAVDIYLNDGFNKVFSYDPNNLPVDPIRGPVLVRELISFRTEHELHPSDHSADSYAFHAFAFALDPVTNLSVDIARFAIAGSPDGFTSSSRTTKLARVFNHDTDHETTAVGIEALELEVEFRRSKSSRMTMCMLSASWALTLVSVYATLMAITKGRVDSTAVVLHASTALAILGIWMIYVGGKPFRVDLGLAGFFSQITTVTFCSIVLLYIAAKPHLSAKGSWQPEKA